ncbi:putative SnoaL-like aldol condensation-catalyzing enzyme [Lentzea atacamensis]|uniref:SnoaL-like aldol condensation-catalyzing enzyme n=1 Tax=Lentzea atacamensis TaxID=531938 RepID=A0ABX9EBD4_9PSEU|nr:nuclear transport factor 2 family protein [Lentzea atacamensis]RAS66834.1 putative SnoaL-like aldol condensation-catalyzing enzyme [Lentzea atacamensis]
MDNKELVLKAAGELFGDKDPSAVDRWVSPDYRQHSALIGDGPEALRGLVADLPEGFHYELARVIADDDLVALHGVYHGFGPEPLVAFDLFRVENGKLAEHWDALTPVVRETAGGRSQTGGRSFGGDTEHSRALVSEFAQRVLQDADYSVLTDYISTETYLQHNPEAADGLTGFGAAAAKWAGEGKNLVYKTIHKAVAEGDLVLLQSEGEFGEPVAYWDLFRVENGRIVEHWDVITPIPASLPHTNGLF